MDQADIAPIRRYFLDTEFADPEAEGVFLFYFISLGLVSEDGDEFYGVLEGIDEDFLAEKKPWLKDNVLAKLPPPEQRVSLEKIREGVLNLIKPAKVIEIWATNGSYDNVGLCRLFGGMDKLREILFEKKAAEEVVFRDMHELHRLHGPARIAGMPEHEKHISVNDARHDKRQHDYYSALSKPKPPLAAPGLA